MKLRLRSLETKETLKIELPNPCTLQQLREIISHRIPSSNSSPSSIHFSLNRKDELHTSSPQDHLHSLGVTSGDLIFFTLNPNSFSSQTLTLVDPNSSSSLNSETLSKSPIVDSNNEAPRLDTGRVETLDLKMEGTSDAAQNSSKSPIVDSNDEIPGLDKQKEETLDLKMEETGDCMEVDEAVSVVDSRKSFSVPGFLRKVFTEELGDGGGRRHELLVIAVHAVLLESGFVGFDPASNLVIKGFHLPTEWPSFGFMMSLYYSLPEVISKSPNNVNGIDYVVLKFQCVGKFFNVYGSLANGTGTMTHWVRVEEEQLVPFLNTVWANCSLIDEIRVKQGFSSTRTTPEAEVFKFWKNVKDMLALPLLMDLCEKAGLDLPLCFMVLPTDIKLKIIESLTGEDTAKVGCVCSELRYLTSSDNLWMKKFEEQFGNVKEPEVRSWKEKFAKEIRKRKYAAIHCGFARRSVFIPRVRFPSVIGGGYDIWPHQGPLLGRNIIGGDYDRLPNIGPLHPRTNPRIRNHMPPCNLEG